MNKLIQQGKQEYFRYEFFLTKSQPEFYQWLETAQLLKTHRAQYIRRESEILIHPEQKCRLLNQIRATILMNALRDHLRELQGRYRLFFTGEGKEDVKVLEEETKVCVEAHNILYDIEYFKKSVEEILKLFDDLLLYQHNPFLFVDIANLIRVQSDLSAAFKKELNLKMYDPCTAEYFALEIKQLCQKYPASFTPKDFEVKGMCPELYQRILSKEIKEADQKRALMVIVSKVFEEKMKDPDVRFDLLTFKYIKLTFLSDEIPMIKQGEQYQQLINQMIPTLSASQRTTRVFLDMEPGIFLQVHEHKKRTGSGEFQKWISSQIQAIMRFVQERTIDPNINPFFLTKTGVFQFLKLINEVVLYIQFIFESNSEIEIYNCYTKMLEFQKFAYLSFNTKEWFVPLNVLLEMNNNVFEDLHIDIDKKIIAGITEMIHRLSRDELPVWIEYKEGRVVETRVGRLEYVSSILYYLEECHAQQNNFFEFPQPIPVDFASSILLMELVNIRFHEFQPNQKQVEYYTTMFQECIKHNVHPSYNWFKPAISYQEQKKEEREIEWEMMREIGDENIRSIFQRIINLREPPHIERSVNNNGSVVKMLDQLRYNIGLNIRSFNMRISNSNSEEYFIVVGMMNSFLYDANFDFSLPEDLVQLNKVHLCAQVCYRIWQKKPCDHLQLIVSKIIIPWIRAPMPVAKRIFKTFFLFFTQEIIAPYNTQIINALYEYMMESDSQTVQQEIVQKVLIIASLAKLQDQNTNERQKQEKSDLAGMIVSVLSEDLSVQQVCSLGLLIYSLLPSDQALNLILNDPVMEQNWFRFLEKVAGDIDPADTDMAEVLSCISFIKRQTRTYIVMNANSIPITLKGLETYFEKLSDKQKGLVDNNCESSLVLLDSLDNLSLGSLLVLLLIQMKKNRGTHIMGLVKAISQTKQKPTQRINLLVLSNFNPTSNIAPQNIISATFRHQYETGSENFNMIMQFMNVLRRVLNDISYFTFARQIGIPCLIPDKFPIESILRVGSDSKLMFTYFIESVFEAAKRPNVIQETTNAIRVLRKEGQKLNVGALFFLAMVVSNCRNKQIQSYLFKSLSECHIFKVRPETPKAKQIVTATLKVSTIIMMQKAQVLMKRCPDNLFTMTNSQRGEYREVIDELFGIIYCLPAQCFKDVKLVKQDSKEMEEEEWESEKESDQEEGKKKKGKKEKSESDHYQENEEEDSNPDSEGIHDSDSYNSDEVQYEQSEITDILLNKSKGFIDYNEYIKIREQLDIAIKGRYSELETAVKEKKEISLEVQEYLKQIVARLSLLGFAQKQVITKMNIHLYNVLRQFGLEEERGVNSDDTEAQKPFKLKFQMFSDSEFDDDSDQGPEDDEDGDDGEDVDSQQYGEVGHEDAEGDQDVERFRVEGDLSGTFNIYIPMNHFEEGSQQQNLEPFNIIEEEGQDMDQSETGENAIEIFLSNYHNKPKNLFMKKVSSVEPHKVETFKHQAFTSHDIDKIIQVLIYKMFEFNTLTFSTYLSFYTEFASFSAGNSSFINSLILLLRIPEQPDARISERFPIINQEANSPGEIFSNYELFCRNTINLLETVNTKNEDISYDKGEPGIETIELIADQYRLQKQAHIISLAMFHYRSNDDQFFDDRQVIQNLCPQFDGGSTKHIKVKHINEMVKSSFKNHCILLSESCLQLFVFDRAVDFIRAYLNQVTPLLLENVRRIHAQLVEVQKQYIAAKGDREDKIIMMFEITKSCAEDWSIYYYSLKSLVQEIVKTRKKKHKEFKDSIIQEIFTNWSLVSALTIAMNHINFTFKYLIKAGEKYSSTMETLILNQIKAPNLIVMLHSAAEKQLNLKEHSMVDWYLQNYMFNPEGFKLKNITQVGNLIYPLLSHEQFCSSKYQKIILPQVFDDPKSGYFLPLAFRYVPVDESVKSSQILHITRECSFDIAFHQLKHSRFQIQYDKEEGNDQGGLKREFMRGWTGKGVHEQFFFIGRILGIAYRDQNLYGGTLDLAMTTALTQYEPDLNLMQDVDPIIYKNLLWIKQNSAADLGLTFTRSIDYYGEQITEDLKQNGSKIEVDDSNKLEYIDLYIKHFLFSGRKQEMADLKRGFYTIVPPKSVSILTPQELLIKIAGIDTIDIAELKKNVTYEGYSEHSEVIKWFWTVVESFSKEQKQTFLHFLTGTHKIPLGLKNYNLTIERVHDITRLPVAHTCFNTLDLPEYTTEAVFVQKLRTAIFQGHDTYSIM